MNWNWTSIDSINALSQREFEALNDSNQITSPFLCFSFIQALEKTHCVGDNTGWLTRHLVIRDETQALIGFLPAYVKTHSYGEYVFDHSWAQAYEQHGLAYYPKLIIAIPFTPVTGPRILLAPHISLDQMTQYIAHINEALMESLSVSSVHFLFTSKQVSCALLNHGFHQRNSVQFNWHNKHYSHIDDFMARLTARRRRSIRKERAGIAKQGVVVKRIISNDILESDMAFFYTCYQQTYLKRSGHTGYLRPEFFYALLNDMSNNLLLVVAYQHADKVNDVDSTFNEPAYVSVKNDISRKSTEQKPQAIAAALFLYDEHGLYGRYWGALSEISGLHFEACYYQGIEFCIEKNIPLFNPGTQGEHKILRGFEPFLCYSNHKMKEDGFDRAIADFLQRETPQIIDYAEKSASLLPYKDINPEK
ncbi:MAG: putative N-acyltransferase [Kangiellaceae bacterium]|jgi:predicted N-acyltransferase